MKKLKDWFRHNSLLKLFSLFLGFVLWLLVVNFSNPKVSGSITIPFDVLNENAVVGTNQVYALDRYDVEVRYQVRAKQRSLVTEDSFNAYINLEDYSVTGAVPVYFEIDANVSELITDVSVDPTIIHVNVEKIQQKRFKIQENVIGTVADGYVAGGLVMTPEYIYVKGPVSVIGQISGACIDVDISGSSSEVTGTSPVYFIDANGNALKGIEENLSFAGDISYTMPVYRIKALAVNAYTSGSPASGYIVDSVETSPTFLNVYGTEEALNQHSYLRISGKALNISGISENKTFTIDPVEYLPEELTPVSVSPEITVYVKVRSIYESPTTGAAVERETEDNSGPPVSSGQEEFGPHLDSTLTAIDSPAAETETIPAEEPVSEAEGSQPELPEETSGESKAESPSSGETSDSEDPEVQTEAEAELPQVP